MSDAPKATSTEPTQVLLVTGMSGAGKSTALKLLEDLGWEAIDNLPLHLLDDLLEPAELQRRPIAVGIDVRARKFDAKAVDAVLTALSGRNDLAVHLLFLDCDDEVLHRRFTETRRRHPLAKDRPVMDGIQQERKMVGPLKDRADLVIDTSQIQSADLKALLTGRYTPRQSTRMTISVQSFSYRRGLPREADIVVDVRFLRNPHYDQALRPLNGRDAAVGAFIDADPAFAPFFETLGGLIASLLPRYAQEGKSYLTVAFGCTGGRHRSVYVAERLARLIEAMGQRVALRHRDVDRNEE